MYSRVGDEVTLTMTQDDFLSLLLYLGYASGAANKAAEIDLFWRMIGFTNRLNVGNPEFRPYDIPEEYIRK